jgi:hypothetical protein
MDRARRCFIFSERIGSLDERWSVVLCVTVRTEGLVKAVAQAVQSQAVSTHFSVAVIHGPILGYTDPAEAPRVTERIIEPFLGKPKAVGETPTRCLASFGTR